MFLLVLVGGSTLAWLSARSVEAENIFTPSQVTCEVTEEFDKETGVKTNVNVRNTGDTEAYIRVKLVTYRTNAAGYHIGGVAELIFAMQKETPEWVRKLHLENLYHRIFREQAVKKDFRTRIFRKKITKYNNQNEIHDYTKDDSR